jgi:hypothetical protein
VCVGAGCETRASAKRGCPQTRTLRHSRNYFRPSFRVSSRQSFRSPHLIASLAGSVRRTVRVPSMLPSDVLPSDDGLPFDGPLLPSNGVVLVTWNRQTQPVDKSRVAWGTSRPCCRTRPRVFLARRIPPRTWWGAGPWGAVPLRAHPPDHHRRPPGLKWYSRRLTARTRRTGYAVAKTRFPQPPDLAGRTTRTG